MIRLEVRSDILRGERLLLGAKPVEHLTSRAYRPATAMRSARDIRKTGP